MGSARNSMLFKFLSIQQKGFIENKPIDLQLSILKPLEVSWMVNAYNYIKSRPDMIIKGAFTAAGIKMGTVTAILYVCSYN